MENHLNKLFSFLIVIMLSFVLSISATADYFNIVGGGGGTGVGTQANVWKVHTISGTEENDAEGLRVYLVDSAGSRVSTVVDLTNSSVATANMNNNLYNNQKVTKIEYMQDENKFVLMNRDITTYTYTLVPSSMKLPKIIPWGESGSTSRISAIKSWFMDNIDNRQWVLSKLGLTESDVRGRGYRLVIEPIAYFRFLGGDYALTATECALLDKGIGGGLYGKMNPLTHWNLPLSMFLEATEFNGSPYQINPWSGATNQKIRDNNLIIKHLGISVISYDGDSIDELVAPPETEITFSIEASPKEYEVKGTAGVPVSIGKDVTIKVDLKQDDDVRKKWKERLEGVATVDVYIKLRQGTENRSLTCVTNGAYSGSVLSGTKITMSASDFVNKLLYNKYTFKDSTGSLMINSGETKKYNYTFSMSVRFTENSRYTTGGTTIIVDALNSEGGPTETDYASFFRDGDPPPQKEYVSYTSSPVAYSELKQGTIGSEEFEAMAGTPTTRDLYFGAGGSEFIVDFKAEYKTDNTAKRTYRAYFSGTECEFKEGDKAKDFTFPSPTGGGSGNVTISSMHTGGTCTVTWTGTTTWTGSGGVSGHTAWVNNTWDDSSYNTALTTAQNYANTVNGTVYSYTAASDNETRQKTDWGASASGSNPHISGTATQGQPYIAPTPPDRNGEGGDPGQEFIAGEYTPGQDNSWTITVTWTVPAHTCCGTCCNHDLPTISDTWTQEITYDYFDAVKMSVWKIEQGYLNGLSAITGGTSSVLTSILQGNPTYFYNIASTETSSAGRFRYTLEAAQHDTVVWNLGTRTNKCNKQDKTWGTGIKYSTTSYPHQDGYLEATASDKDKLTTEYAKFKEYREKPVTATVISDFLILQTSSGDQSVLYYQKQSNSVQAQQDFNYVSFTKSAGWNSNSKSAANWSTGHINIGSYNGKYSDTSNKYKGSGSNNNIATIFDNDPANTITRTARPSVALRIAKYNIDIKNTIPNDDYRTGIARVFWELKLNYNPENLTQKYNVSAQSLFGNKSGYTKTAPYSPNHIKINDIVIHNPVSTEYSMVLAVDNARDQRSDNSSSWAEQRTLTAEGCTGNPEECEHRILACTYAGAISHSAACYSSTTPRTLNAHHHNTSCIDTNRIQQAVQRQSGSETFNYTGNYQTFTAPATATYTFKVWGAQGGGTSGNGGKGGYAEGTYYLTAGQTVYIYVGGQPSGKTGGFNGGGTSSGANNSFGGGGATDIRVNSTALANRVIVAGGGGGQGAYTVGTIDGGGSGIYVGGNGGGSSGSRGSGYNETGGHGGNSGYAFTSQNGAGGGGGGGHINGNAGSFMSDGSFDWSGEFFGAGGGGSGYIGGVSGGSMQSGVNSGNGKVVISYNSGNYVGTSWGLLDIDEIIVNSNIRVTDVWISKQPTNAIIFNCGNPLNVHICNASCSHEAILICNEPHHEGNHYDISNTTCWSACNDDSKHKPITNASGLTMGYFINLDWGFQIYFPTIGDFYQTGAYGISEITSLRGKGYVNNMQTSEWVAKKRVKFSYDVIYCGATTAVNPNGSQHGNMSDGSSNHKHTASCSLIRAGTWIEIPKEYQFFNFYCVGSNSEIAAGTATFEVIAINAPYPENDNTLPTNRLRDMAFEAKHGGIKTNYIDVVGRVGNLVMEDTGDYRFTNLFKMPVAGNSVDDYYIQGILKRIDINSKNYVLAPSVDIRGLAINSSFGQDIFGTLTWLKNKLVDFPLSPDKNTINALKNEPLRFGYKTYLDITTLGKDYSTIDIVPHYYYYDTVTRTAVPVDVYAFTSSGYEPINLHMNAYKGAAAENVYDLREWIEWRNEKQLRNVSDAEILLTDTLAGLYGLPSPTQEVKYSIGNSDFINVNERLRTFTGSSKTYGYEQNIGGLIAGSEFQRAVKRWHFTLGLPSSAVVVDKGAEPTTENIKKYKNGSGVVLMAADIFATSDLYTLSYNNPNSGYFIFDGVTYNIPSNINNVIAVYNGNGKSAKDDLQISKTH